MISVFENIICSEQSMSFPNRVSKLFRSKSRRCSSLVNRFVASQTCSFRYKCSTLRKYASKYQNANHGRNATRVSSRFPLTNSEVATNVIAAPFTKNELFPILLITFCDSSTSLNRYSRRTFSSIVPESSVICRKLQV